MAPMNDNNYWDMTFRRYFREDALWGIYLERLLAWHTILPLVPDRGSLLDVGCGAGGFLAYLKHSRPGLSLVGVDFAESAIEMARRAMPDAEFHCSPAQDLPFADDHFETVYSGHMIEHLAEPVPALAEQLRVLKPGGRVIILFPYDDAPYVEHVHDHLLYLDVAVWMKAAGFHVEGRLTPLEANPSKEEGIIFGSKP